MPSNRRIVPEGAKRHSRAPIESIPEVRPSSTGVRVHAPGRPDGPSVSVPFIVQAWDGPDVVDLVPINRLEPRPEGAVWMSGRGSRFTAEASWSPIPSPVPRWDVAIELRFVGAQPVDAAIAFAVRLRATSEPGWMIRACSTERIVPPRAARGTRGSSRQCRASQVRRPRVVLQIGSHRAIGPSARTGRPHRSSLAATAEPARRWRRRSLARLGSRGLPLQPTATASSFDRGSHTARSRGSTTVRRRSERLTSERTDGSRAKPSH